MNRPTAPGFLVTFEGGEGAGKSTQAALLETRLADRAGRVRLTREPGGVPLAESVRDLLLDPAGAGMAPLTELFLILAARAEHVERVVVPALRAGQLILIDRFIDATIAYQSGGRGLPRDLVRQLGEPAAAGLVPDITFLLDLDPECGFARRGPRARERDRLEGEDLAFHRRVRETYRELAGLEPERFVVVNADRDFETVHRVIREELTRRARTAGWRVPGA